MAAGRFLSKTIAQSEQLGRVSLEADYLFMRCIPHLDREGRMPGHPELVRALVCPLRAELTVPRVAQALEELAQVGLVIRYDAGEARQCLAFPGFARHQQGLRKDREAPSRFPAPEGNGAHPQIAASESGPAPGEPPAAVPQDAPVVAHGKTPEHSGVSPEASGPDPPEVEVEVKSKSRTTSAAARQRKTWLTPFGEAWHARYGGEPAYGELAAHLSPLRADHVLGEMLEHWTRYLEATEAKYVSPARFAQTYGHWGKPPRPAVDARPDMYLTLEEQEARRAKARGQAKPGPTHIGDGLVLP